ncbi:MAG: hypothetical protein Q8K01_08475 [Sulfurimicrobium sp.]|nr:hypothetical protein [Sulfurimicrobium sp.]MDP2198603.1 hypothetical protein [Sulfurimicrobium sp.]
MKKMFCILAAMLVATPVLAAKFTDEELTAMALKNGAKNKGEINSREFVFSLNPALVYAEAFNTEEKSLATPETKDADMVKGVEAAATTVATSPFFVAGGVNSATGAIGNAATVVAVAGVGLNYISSMFNAGNRQRGNAMRALNKPSFYLTRLVADVNNDDKLKAIQAEAIQVAATLPFACEPAANFLGEKAPSTIIPGILHYRDVFCGYDSNNKEVEVDSPRKEIRSIKSVRFYQPYGIEEAVNVIDLSSLDSLRYTAMLGIPEADSEQEKQLGRLAYEKANPFIPPDWTAVYTAPNSKDEWAVFVARNGVTMEFPVVKK